MCKNQQLKETLFVEAVTAIDLKVIPTPTDYLIGSFSKHCDKIDKETKNEGLICILCPAF